MKTKISLLLGILFVAQLGLARTLLISDIDDTLKISHVRYKVDSVENSMALGNLFTGMNELFRVVERQNPQLKFFYVSNAVDSLDVMPYLHTRFLNDNEFPAGPLYLRDSVFVGNQKFQIISKILREQKPDRVFLIGDNGELDPVVYSRLQKAFPQVQFHVDIHLAYSVESIAETGNPLQVNQTGYVTSVDLAQDLKKQGLMSDSAFQQFIRSYIPRILKEDEQADQGELAIPNWMNCWDYQEKMEATTDPLLLQYQKFLRFRCALDP